MAGWVIDASAADNGEIHPSGAVVVSDGGTTNFVIAPETYWHVGDVTTNGASVGAVTNFTWTNVIADGTINASFAADLAARSTPHWWLAQYGLTNGGASFDEAETNDTDTDSFSARDEQIADTNPTNGQSYFRATAITRSSPMAVRFESSSNRMYLLQGASNLVTGAWTNVPGGGPRLGAGGADSMDDTNKPAKGPFYRLNAELP